MKRKYLFGLNCNRRCQDGNVRIGTFLKEHSLNGNMSQITLHRKLDVEDV